MPLSGVVADRKAGYASRLSEHSCGLATSRVRPPTHAPPPSPPPTRAPRLAHTNPDNDPRHATALAHEALSAGNLPLAWCAASELRRRKLASPAILNMLGLIEVKVGAYAAARAACAEALALSPRDKALRANLDHALDLEGRFGANELHGEAAPHEMLSALGARVHLIRAWGHGFCADVDHVLGHALLAEIQGRTPVVWWGESSLFHDAGVANAWDAFFEPVGDLGAVLAAIEMHGAKPGAIYPGKWNRDASGGAAVRQRLAGPALNAYAGEGSRLGSPLLVNRAELITVGDYFVGPIEAQTWSNPGHWSYRKPIDAVYRVLVDRYLRPTARVRELVERAARDLALGDPSRPVIAVHVREGDKSSEMPEIAAHNADAMQVVRNQLNSDARWRVLLITDSIHAVARYRDEFADRLLVLDATRSSDQTGVHTVAAAGERERLGLEVMRDVLLAARCDRFVGVAFSNVAAMISHLRDWPRNSCTLIGEALQAQINFLPHVWPR